MRTFLLALAFAAAAAPPATADHCKSIQGPFTSVLVPPPTCQSPIGLCTHGILTGDLEASYDFTFETLDPAGDPNDPQKFVYTGHSVITRDHGGAQMFSDDHGVIEFNPAGDSAFITTVMVLSGTKQYSDATGSIVASGELNFITGQAEGSYTGSICK